MSAFVFDDFSELLLRAFISLIKDLKSAQTGDSA